MTFLSESEKNTCIQSKNGGSVSLSILFHFLYLCFSDIFESKKTKKVWNIWNAQIRKVYLALVASRTTFVYDSRVATATCQIHLLISCVTWVSVIYFSGTLTHASSSLQNVWRFSHFKWLYFNEAHSKHINLFCLWCTTSLSIHVCLLYSPRRYSYTHLSLMAERMGGRVGIFLLLCQWAGLQNTRIW